MSQCYRGVLFGIIFESIFKTKMVKCTWFFLRILLFAKSKQKMKAASSFVSCSHQIFGIISKFNDFSLVGIQIYL